MVADILPVRAGSFRCRLIIHFGQICDRGQLFLMYRSCRELLDQGLGFVDGSQVVANRHLPPQCFSDSICEVGLVGLQSRQERQQRLAKVFAPGLGDLGLICCLDDLMAAVEERRKIEPESLGVSGNGILRSVSFEVRAVLARNETNLDQAADVAPERPVVVEYRALLNGPVRGKDNRLAPILEEGEQGAKGMDRSRAQAKEFARFLKPVEGVP